MSALTDARSVETADVYCKSNLDLPYECGADTTTIVAPLYFVVVARAAYTPASGEIFTLRVGAVIQ